MGKLIVQEYLKNIMLINGRKFDIRVYMLQLTIQGRIKYYFYEEGYIRTSSEFYDLDNLSDRFIHLTNDAVQNRGDNYGKFEKGNKMSYHEFQRHLDQNFNHSKAIPPKYKAVRPHTNNTCYTI